MHCTACGTRLERRLVEGRERGVCPACGHVHWGNPVPAVGAVLVRGGRVLLCRRGRPPKEGEWDLPGGFIEADEGPEDALRRELQEELGLTPRVVGLVCVLPGAYDARHTLNLVYAVEADGEPRADDDVAEVRWFPLDALPPIAWAHEAEALRRVAQAG